MRERRQAKVLVVDDNAAQRARAARRCSRTSTSTVVEAASGREALRCLLQQEFAVILLDVNMPGLDGFETAALIRQRPQLRAHADHLRHRLQRRRARRARLLAGRGRLHPGAGAARGAAHQGRRCSSSSTARPSRSRASARRCDRYADAAAAAQPGLAGDPLGALRRRRAARSWPTTPARIIGARQASVTRAARRTAARHHRHGRGDRQRRRGDPHRAASPRSIAPATRHRTVPHDALLEPAHHGAGARAGGSSPRLPDARLAGARR